MAENVDFVQKHKIANISKTVNRTKNIAVSFLCSSSRGIQQFLFQVATTNSFRGMTENVDFVHDRKMKSRKYLENGASDQKSMSNGFVQLVERNPMVFWSVLGRYHQ